jgi:hypothetical protein
MDDLEKLNRRIASHWLGNLDARQQTYLGYASTCVGLLQHSAAELAERLEYLKQNRGDPLRTAKLNRHYLRFARLVAAEAVDGKLEMLVMLAMTLEQAELLRNLSDEDVDCLAFGWNGPIIRFASQPFFRGAVLHAQAAKHHATAFVATGSLTQSDGAT